MAVELIPLFPLEVVLFPGVSLPLHIFEPRYKQMIRDCLELNAPFGVVLERRQGVAPVGCTASIGEIARNYPDGRMDILTSGQTPFRIVQVREEKPYFEAEVDFLPDDPAPAEPDIQSELSSLYRRCHTLVYGQPPNSTESEGSLLLSYQIATELPVTLDLRQSLLETRAESRRQMHLLKHLREWIPKLTHLKQVRSKASGNGHGGAAKPAG